MKLEKRASIAEIVSGIAIVISLIMLIVEVRQNSDAVEASNRQSVAARTEQITLATATDPEPGELIWRPMGVSIEEARTRAFWALMLSHIEETYLQYRDGRLEEDYFLARARRGLFILDSDEGRQEYVRQRDLGIYVPEFTEWLDETYGIQ